MLKCSKLKSLSFLTVFCLHFTIAGDETVLVLGEGEGQVVVHAVIVGGWQPAHPIFRYLSSHIWRGATFSFQNRRSVGCLRPVRRGDDGDCRAVELKPRGTVGSLEAGVLYSCRASVSIYLHFGHHFWLFQSTFIRFISGHRILKPQQTKLGLGLLVAHQEHGQDTDNNQNNNNTCNSSVHPAALCCIQVNLLNKVSGSI